MIFLLFVASVISVEAILRHEERRALKRTVQTRGGISIAEAGPASDSILALIHALAQDGHGRTPQVATPVHQQVAQ